MARYHQLTEQGYDKICRILQYDEELLQQERESYEIDSELGYKDNKKAKSLYKRNGSFNMETVTQRGGVDKRTTKNIMEMETVKPSSLRNFITTFKERHKDSKDIDDDDYYELIEEEDYIICLKSSNSRQVKKNTSLSQLQNPPIEQLKTALFDLNYKYQIRLFEDTIYKINTGAFLVYGQMNHGQKWLVNRLSNQIPYGSNAVKKGINLKRSRHYLKLDNLWQDLASELGTYNHNLDNLVDTIYENNKTSTVILCLHNFDVISNNEQIQIIKFWQKIVENSTKIQFPIILFLTANKQLTSNANHNFFILNELNPFGDGEITHWITTHTHLFENEQKTDPTLENLIKDILEYNQTPINIFSKIAEYCNLDWFDIERSLSL